MHIGKWCPPSTSRKPVFVVVIDVADDLVQTIHAIANPDKLAHLS